MSQGRPIKDRRENCDNCVKDDFAGLVKAVNELTGKVGKILGASPWQKAIILLLLAGALGGTLVSSYAAIATADTNGEQNTSIALIKKDVDNNTKNIEKMNDNVDRLVIAQEKLVVILTERHNREDEEED